MALRDAQTGDGIFVNTDDRSDAASLMKLPVMMTAFELAGRGEAMVVLRSEERRSMIAGGTPAGVWRDRGQQDRLDFMGRA